VAVTHDEAARILGVHPTTVWRLIRRNELARAAPLKTARLDRTQVEQLAARRAVRGRRPNPYFMSAHEVAETLGIVRQLVDRLAAADRLPYVDTGLSKPRRLYRRAQIEVIAAARARRQEVRDRTGQPLGGTLRQNAA